MENWKPIQEHPISLSGREGIEAPLVLLWEKKTGHALGKVFRYADGDIFTIAPGYHGFSFTHYQELSKPNE